MEYKEILKPGKIGSVLTRNRIIKTGASMMYWHKDEIRMNEITKAFYGALAKGGVGLLIVESPVIDFPKGARWVNQYRIDDDIYISGLKELVDEIHKYGCPTFMQMVHLGPWQNPLFPYETPLYEGPPIGASPVNIDLETEFHRDIIRPLSKEEIREIVEKFGLAALRAKKAGFDGVDINAGSSHLFHNFLSPFWNRRSDEYGGTTENRARFLVEVIREIKKRCGDDFPVTVCMNGIEIGRAIGIEDNRCLTTEESRKIAVLLEKAGVDAIQVRNHWLGFHVGGFLPEQLFFPEPPIPTKEFPKEYYWKKHGAGANIYLAEGIKKVVSIPVIIVGRIDPDLGEKILREKKADFIAMSRRLFADPELPNKLAQRRPEDIVPCTACGTCLDQSRGMHRRCRVNAALGTTDYSLPTAEKKKRVAIIGAGPAGMEAARIAALRGHEVFLFEKEKRLGGLLPMATFIKGTETEDIYVLIKFLVSQIRKLGVVVIKGKKATVREIKRVNPDVVIVATGGEPKALVLQGESSRKIKQSAEFHAKLKFYLRFLNPRLLRWLSRFFLPVGKEVVIVGGQIHGMEVAEFLVKRGRKVSIVEKDETIGKGMVDFRLHLLLAWFKKKGVIIYSGVKEWRTVKEGLEIIDRDGVTKILKADTIVVSLPPSSNSSLYEELRSEFPDVFIIGDAKDPRLIVDAIREGYEVAKNI
ncbi:MAG: FAD-dependent oxidoreductase [Deltaproteobacteria bacterium]|nr:FAD-dependent oxidoreductase [Deltaproteobacteria bacterium]